MRLVLIQWAGSNFLRDADSEREQAKGYKQRLKRNFKSFQAGEHFAAYCSTKDWQRFGVLMLRVAEKL
jgi:hypothetical protein